MKNSEIIIARNIKLDRDYKNVLSYNEASMVSLVRANAVASSNNYSFIKPGKNQIDVSFSYSNCLKCNYMAFQNPYYSNKWFFAFIDEVEFRNQNTTRITFIVDVFSTWFDYWQVNSCFVLREHVNDDTVGLHTVPENLETGEFICNSHYKDSTMDSYASDLCYIMASTSEPITGDAKDTVAPSAIYNGIYTGLTYYRYDATSAIDIILEIFAQNAKTNAINGIFMSPKWLATLSGDAYRSVKQTNSPNEFNITVTKQNTLNGYTPKNNKLRCFPFNYLLISNNIGQNGILHYEKFSGDNATFKVRGVLNPGCSINLTPTNYNGSASSDNDAIQLGKFPICNFQNDMYTNWLTQNSINVLGMTVTSDDLNFANNMLGSSLNLLGDVGSLNVGGAISDVGGTLTSAASSMIQKKQHNMISPSVVGQLNSADVNVASGNNTFHFYKMSVKKEFAESIDNYFTRYGYAINKIKVPNQTGRPYFNYVQIASDSDIGYPNSTVYGIPADDMKKINDIYRRGVTIWHNHTNLGNYSLDNSIQ